MKKILVLDADQKMHNSFYDLFRGKLVDVVHVYSYLDCVNALQEHVFDLAFLDHDLSNLSGKSIVKDMSKSKELTGTDVVRFIEESLEPEMRPAAVVVHSYNQWGARRMVTELRAMDIHATHMPFDLTSFQKLLISWLNLPEE